MKTVKLKNNEFDYKSFVGPRNLYEIIGITQFALLSFYGLKPTDKVLDIGCGSLRLGKYLMQFLKKNNYFGIEPNFWLIEEALKNETFGNKENIIFATNNKFDLLVFNKKFDWIIANSIFIHASLKEIKKCIAEAYKTLTSKGELIFSYIEGEDNKKDAWSYPEYVTYEKDTLKCIAEEIGFAWNDIEWFYPGKQKFVKLYKNDLSLGN